MIEAGFPKKIGEEIFKNQKNKWKVKTDEESTFKQHKIDKID